MTRPSYSLGHYFTPFFPTPAAIGAQASQAPFQANGHEPFISGAGMPWSGHPSANALVPPAVAPQTFQPESHPCWTMPQAGVVPNASPFQHFSGAAVQPLHGEELAARVAAININILASQPSQPNNYTHGWPQPLPQQQQAPPAPLYPAIQPVGPGDSAVWGVPSPPPQDAPFYQWPTVDMAPNCNSAPIGADIYGATGWAPPEQQPGGQTSWALPVQQPGGQTSWALPVQQPGVPAAPPASGSAQAQPLVPGKTFEEFLMEAGVLDEWAVDDIILKDFIEDLLGDGQAELGQVEPDSPMVSLGGGGLPPPPPGLCMVRAQEEQEPVGSAVDGCGRDSEASAEARARRGRRMTKRKEAIARARPGN